jgi:hypothetical protein
VLDFPKQKVISRDNASISLDAVLSFRVTNPQKMIYNSVNLPWMLSKLLQAQVRKEETRDAGRQGRRQRQTETDRERQRQTETDSGTETRRQGDKEKRPRGG